MATYKKIKQICLLVIFTICLNNFIFSQPPSVATDFTYQDINGVTHHLYDYLDSGKPVIIDFSTTWCSPCWYLHNTHLLGEIYNDFGPDGTDELMVLFIEIDAATTLDNLNGIGSGTQGDWVTGTPYPIIDLPTSTDVDFFNNNYNLAYVPTIYVICPDSSVSEMFYNTISYYNIMSEVAKCTQINGIDARMLMYSGDEGICGDTEVRAVIYNNGTDTLTNLLIDAYWEGNLITNINWSGNLLPDDTVDIDFGTITISQDSANFSFEITTLDDNMSNNIFSKTVFFAPFVSNQIRVNISTSDMLMPIDVRWKVEDDNSNIIVQSNYLDMLTTYDSVYTIPLGCHHFIITSDMGSGLDGSISVSDNITQEIIYNNSAFGYQGNSSFIVDSSSEIINLNIQNSKISFSPNPVNDKLTLHFSQDKPADITVHIINALGQVVYCSNLNKFTNKISTIDIDMSGLTKGIYILNILIDHQNISEKIIKQ